MTILGKDILHRHGPYVAFPVLDVPPATEEWQVHPKFAHHVRLPRPNKTVVSLSLDIRSWPPLQKNVWLLQDLYFGGSDLLLGIANR